jgi:hypothetical protein
MLEFFEPQRRRERKVLSFIFSALFASLRLKKLGWLHSPFVNRHSPLVTKSSASPFSPPEKEYYSR